MLFIGVLIQAYAQSAYVGCSPNDYNNNFTFEDVQNDVRVGFPTSTTGPFTFEDLAGGRISNDNLKLEIKLNVAKLPDYVGVNQSSKGILEYNWYISLTGSLQDKYKIGVFYYSSGEAKKLLNINEFNVQVLKNDQNIGGCGKILKSDNSMIIRCDKQVLTDLSKADQNRQFNVNMLYNNGTHEFKDCF